jgi:pyruvate dehydrogenase E2 component (dihydrolipoamide acetyltransferase)
MATNICMPALGHTMENGKIVEWKIAEGQAIAVGEPLVSIETDKSIIDVDSPVAGQVLRIVIQPGQNCPVGDTIAWIGEAGEAVPETSAAAPAASSSATPDFDRVTPVARKLADRHGIDADALVGTGPGGRVTKEDVKRAIDAKQ